MLFIGILVFNYFTYILRTDVEKSTQNMLEQERAMMDMRLLEMQRMTVQISTSSSLSPYILSENAYRTLQGIKELRNYVATNSFISDIFVYMRGGDFIYSPFGTYTPSSFIRKVFVYKDWEEKDFLYTLENVEEAMLRPAEEVAINQSGDKDSGNQKYITHIFLLPASGASSYGTVMFQVKEKEYLDLIKNTLKDYSGNTIILDSSGTMVTCLEKSPFIESKEFKELLNVSSNKGSQTVLLDNTKYLFSYVKSQNTGWTYITVIPYNDVMKRVSDMRNLSLNGMLLVIFLSSLLIYIMTYKNYSKIRQLNDLAKGSEGTAPSGKDELDSIRKAITGLTHTNAALSSMVKSGKMAMKDYLLSNLLKGSIYDLEGMEQKALGTDIYFKYGYYIVAIFAQQDKGSTNTYNLFQKLENDMPDGLQGYFKDSFEKGVVFLVATVKNPEPDFIRKKLAVIRETVRKEMGVSVSVGLGGCYESPQQIGKSFIEATTALNYRLIFGNDRLISFADISKEAGGIDNYPGQKIQNLESALKLGDTEGIAGVIEDILNSIRNLGFPIYLVRCICFDMISTIIKVMNEKSVEFCIDRKTYPDAASIMDFETVEELEGMIKTLCLDLCSQIAKSKENNSFDLKSRIIAYVKSDFMNYDFSVQKMASELNVSVSYLSRYFKEQTGSNISDYVNHLKIDYAKQLLVQKDEPMEEVIKQVGYCDVSSFIRKFKKQCGITPGEYRRLNKNL